MNISLKERSNTRANNYKSLNYVFKTHHREGFGGRTVGVGEETGGIGYVLRI